MIVKPWIYMHGHTAEKSLLLLPWVHDLAPTREGKTESKWMDTLILSSKNSYLTPPTHTDTQTQTYTHTQLYDYTTYQEADR